MNPILYAFGGGIITLLLAVSLLLCFAVGPETMIGYWTYFIGWLLVGHGWEVGPLKVNILLVWIIGITFATWSGARYVARKYNKPFEMFTSFLLWTVIFIIIVAAWTLLGHGLMYLAIEYFYIDVYGIDGFLQIYEEYDMILDTLFALPTLILIYFSVVKGYRKYH